MLFCYIPTSESFCSLNARFQVWAAVSTGQCSFHKIVLVTCSQIQICCFCYIPTSEACCSPNARFQVWPTVSTGQCCFHKIVLVTCSQIQICCFCYIPTSEACCSPNARFQVWPTVSTGQCCFHKIVLVTCSQIQIYCFAIFQLPRLSVLCFLDFKSDQQLLLGSALFIRKYWSDSNICCFATWFLSLAELLVFRKIPEMRKF